MIVVAIPTIVERADAWKDAAQAWYESTTEPLICTPSWRLGGWAQGLNEVWESFPEPEAFICGSDDMVPEDGWLEACKPYLEQNRIIAPQVIDPRFNRWPEDQEPGEITRMSSFPILPGVVLPHVFPIKAHEPQHYYADDKISDKAREAGFETVAVPGCVIRHLMDERGRGAGMGSEELRMAHDRQVYKAQKL